MTTLSDTTVTVPQRLDLEALAPEFSRAVNALDDAATHELDQAGIDPALRELVRLRASQLNGCAYCVDLHARGARDAGAGAQRVDALAVWRDSGLFTAPERAALALTEDLVRLSETHAPAPVVDAAVAAFGEDGASALICLVIAIGAWNTIGVSTRCWAVHARD